MVARHGRSRLAASARGGTDHPGYAVTGSVDTGNKHVLGQLLFSFYINRTVNRKTVVALFHQQGVAGIGAVEAVGGQMAAIHEYPGVGQIFGSVQTFAVDIGIKVACFFSFPVKKRIHITVQDIGTVKHVGGTGNFYGRI